MKRILCLLLCAAMLISGCGKSGEITVTAGTTETAEAQPAAETAENTGETQTPAGTQESAEEQSVSPDESETGEPETEAVPEVSDGRDRPSSAGHLQVLEGRLCGEDGTPVMLRGASSYGISMSERFINQKLFSELSGEQGFNVFRLAMYTYGVGVVGYCTGGDQKRLKQDVIDGVEFAKNADMYAIIDWHILEDGDPNRYIEEAKAFFDEMSELFSDYDNVMYELCNEPNGVEWSAIKSYAEVIIPIIRANDPDSVIIVGTPNWSQRLDAAAADPLEYDNILYTLHFYSATHKEELRSIVRSAAEAGLPIFSTEFGVTSASGGFPIDTEEADVWIELLEELGISYCMWSFSNVAEPCSAVQYACKKSYGFTEEDYSEAGLWLLATVESHK